MSFLNSFFAFFFVLGLALEPTAGFALNCRNQFSKTKSQFIQNYFNNPARLIEYQGQEGYILFAQAHYNSNLKKAFENVSAVLSKREFLILGWQQYKGSVTAFQTDKRRLLNTRGRVKQKHKGPKGYKAYADKYYHGNMKKAFENVSAVLSKREFSTLRWQDYQGSSTEFLQERTRLTEKKGLIHSSYKIKSEYIGRGGYVRYAEEFYEGNMKKSFSNVSAVLAKEEFSTLGWQLYQGFTNNFRKERRQILNSNGSQTKEKYKSMEGLAQYAEEFYEGNISTTFRNVSAVLAKEEFSTLGWKLYQGSTKKFRKERNQILNSSGSQTKEKYKGMEGLVQYAEEFYEGIIVTAFRNVSAVLEKEEFSLLDWKSIYGTTYQYRQLIEYFSNSKLEDHLGFEGQEKIALSIFKGNSSYVYSNVSMLRNIIFSDPYQFNDLRESGWRK